MHMELHMSLHYLPTVVHTNDLSIDGIEFLPARNKPLFPLIHPELRNSLGPSVMGLVLYLHKLS